MFGIGAPQPNIIYYTLYRPGYIPHPCRPLPKFSDWCFSPVAVVNVGSVGIEKLPTNFSDLLINILVKFEIILCNWQRCFSWGCVTKRRKKAKLSLSLACCSVFLMSNHLLGHQEFWEPVDPPAAMFPSWCWSHEDIPHLVWVSRPAGLQELHQPHYPPGHGHPPTRHQPQQSTRYGTGVHTVQICCSNLPGISFYSILCIRHIFSST